MAKKETPRFATSTVLFRPHLRQSHAQADISVLDEVVQIDSVLECCILTLETAVSVRIPLSRRLVSHRVGIHLELSRPAT